MLLINFLIVLIAAINFYHHVLTHTVIKYGDSVPRALRKWLNQFRCSLEY